MTYLNPKIKQRLQEKLKKLNSLRPLPKSAVEKLKSQFEIEMTYNSNAIEGNSLTLKETFLVLNEGITIKNKPLKDHLEAKNHKEALEYLYELVDKDKKNTISAKLIRELNQIVMKEIDKDWAGKYRNSSVIIGGAKHTPPDAIEIDKSIKDLMNWYAKKTKKMHPVELSAILHHKLVFNHPFFDGNGRTARLLMNVVLMRAGYPLAVILKNDRKKYYDVLAKADKGDYKMLVNFVAGAVERTLDIYLKILTPSNKNSENFITLSEASKITKFSAKYLNLLVRQGKLEAHKQGRNWLTTKKAIDRYLANRQRQRN